MMTPALIWSSVIPRGTSPQNLYRETVEDLSTRVSHGFQDLTGGMTHGIQRLTDWRRKTILTPTEREPQSEDWIGSRGYDEFQQNQFCGLDEDFYSRTSLVSGSRLHFLLRLINSNWTNIRRAPTIRSKRFHQKRHSPIPPKVFRLYPPIHKPQKLLMLPRKVHPRSWPPGRGTCSANSRPNRRHSRQGPTRQSEPTRAEKFSSSCMLWNSVKNKLQWPRWFRKCYKGNSSEEWVEVADETKSRGRKPELMGIGDLRRNEGGSRPNEANGGRGEKNENLEDLRELIDFCEKSGFDNPKIQKRCGTSSRKNRIPNGNNSQNTQIYNFPIFDKDEA